MKWGAAEILAVVGTGAGIYVIFLELPFLATRSSLAPVLTAAGVGIAALGVALLLSSRRTS